MRQRKIIGDILEVDLGDGARTYVQALDDADMAFFDTRTTIEMSPIEIVARPVLFRIAVHKSAWVTGRWKRVDRLPLSPALQAPEPKFIQDALHPDRFQIYLAGDIRPATKAECVGLERCAVWDPEHAEDRLRDHYNGVPCKWVDNLKIDTREFATG
jgi:Immunity protein 26